MVSESQDGFIKAAKGCNGERQWEGREDHNDLRRRAANEGSTQEFAVAESFSDNDRDCQRRQGREAVRVFA